MKSNIIHGLIILFCFFGLVSSAFAEEYRVGISVSHESLDDGSASGIAIYSENFNVLYAGFTLNQVTTPALVTYRDTETITPLFFFISVKAPWRLAPYIEGGLDFIELVVDDATKSDEEQSADDIDYYYAGGITYSINDHFAVSFYAKKYVFLYPDALNTYQIKTSPSGYGAGISILF